MLAADGTECPLADDELTFEVSGAGEFKAACNGDATSLESFTQPRMRLFSGKLVLIVQSLKQAGDILDCCARAFTRVLATVQSPKWR